jgi:CRP/FNR family transcriptional regulator, cyclic AMP receptor protein
MSQSLLQNVYLFKSMTADELKTITTISESKSFNTGDSVFLRGEPGMAMYLIKYGSVNITQSSKTGNDVVIATLGTGSHFGEMPFFDGETRSATATTKEGCELIVLPYDKLSALLEKHPAIAVKFFKNTSRFLCGRLRATTADLGFAREQNMGALV